MTIHRHGNAITFNQGFWQTGVRPWQEYQGDLPRFGQDLKRYFGQLPLDQRVFAVVLSSSIYEYFVRYLVAAAGVDPIQEFRVIITPPPQMVSNMRMGAMQAYMVAEPWNTRAIAGNEGIGFTVAQGREIWLGHPDRVLAVSQTFIDQYPKTYRSLVKAMIEACQYCSRAENRREVARIISQRAFTGAKNEYTRPGIVGDYNYGGFDGQPRWRNNIDTTIFFELPPELAQISHDHSTFLWQSQGLWLMTQATRWGQVRALPAQTDAILRQAWRTDLYREIAAEMGLTCPAEDYKVEPGERFIDQRAFDPSDLQSYIQDFEIRAHRPQILALS